MVLGQDIRYIYIYVAILLVRMFIQYIDVNICSSSSRYHVRNSANSAD
jgi:hypothetical protein